MTHVMTRCSKFANGWKCQLVYDDSNIKNGRRSWVHHGKKHVLIDVTGKSFTELVKVPYYRVRRS